MIRLPLLILAPLVATLACVPRSSHPDGAGVDDEAAVRRVEAEIVDAENRGNADAFERLLAPDWTFVNPGGGVFDKTRYLRLVRTDSLHPTSYTVDSMTVRMYGTAAVVVYRSSVVGNFAGRDISSRRRRTTLLVKRDGRWLVVAQQSTPITPR